MTLLNRTLLALALMAVLTLTACDISVVDPDPDPDPDPQPVTLTIDWDTVYVYGDCEGSIPASNTGDFVFNLSVTSDIGGTTTVMDDRNSNPNTGDSVPMGYSNLTFSALDNEADNVRVRFEATETDPTGPDNDMDGRVGTLTHSFSSGRWSTLGDQRIRLGSDSDCRVELRYTATSS